MPPTETDPTLIEAVGEEAKRLMREEGIPPTLLNDVERERLIVRAFARVRGRGVA